MKFYNYKKAIVFSTVFIGLFILTSCASTVKTIKDDNAANLSDSRGYLFMEVDTNTGLESITIDGLRDFEITKSDLVKGSNYLLFELPEGKYRISRIKKGILYFDLDANDYWAFTIKKGTISYVGSLKINSYFIYAYFEVLNQSSYALTYLEQNFPSILSEYAIVYAGPGEDRFLSYVTKEGAK